MFLIEKIFGKKRSEQFQTQLRHQNFTAQRDIPPKTQMIMKTNNFSKTTRDYWYNW
jgi:hypothetical protein